MSIFLIKNHLKISNEIIILLFHKMNKKNTQLLQKTNDPSFRNTD